jgi:UbiD family decarboxylase
MTKGLRDWIAEVEHFGDLKVIRGANAEEEIGGFVDIYQRRMGNPALMFEDIPGVPSTHRVMANLLTSRKRINLALGLPPDGTEKELIAWWRTFMRDAPSRPPRVVNTGAVLENSMRGPEVDLRRFPQPVWHEGDGGPYIGTGCMVAIKDPDTDWVNYGCYRIQVHGPDVVTVYISPGKHGRILMEKYHRLGKPCPVAIVLGMHPSMLMLAGLEIPYGKNEIEAAGGILGEAVDVVRLPETGLPVPADSEIALEGYIHPNDMLKEGPLGEWTGYTPVGGGPSPAIRLTNVMYRNDPIVLGAVPAVPPNDNTYYLGTYRAGAVWNQLEAAGIPEVKGVWTHEAGGSRFMTVVSIKQLYGGHSRQAGHVAASCLAGAFCNRWTIVVDDDIDPTNFNDVIWAMCSRFDPRHQLDLIHGGWSSSLDPMCYDPINDKRNSRLVIDACIPFDRRATFPPKARASKALDDRMRAKWKKDLPAEF